MKEKLTIGLAYHFDLVPAGSVEGTVKELRESCFILTLKDGTGTSVRYNRIWNCLELEEDCDCYQVSNEEYYCCPRHGGKYVKDEGPHDTEDTDYR
jgi:hypothetical protein